MMTSRTLAALALAVLLTACASSSKLMLGDARPAIDPSEVRIYRAPPPGAVNIAEIDASSAIGFGTRGQDDAVIERLKREAAALGANGLLLLGRGHGNSPVGLSVGAGSYGRRSGGSVGVGIPTTQKSATAVAIFVPTHDDSTTGD